MSSEFKDSKLEPKLDRESALRDMNHLRHEIDDLHHQLFSLIEKRIAVTKKIWRLKNLWKLPLNDMERELFILDLPLQHHGQKTVADRPSTVDREALEIYQKLTRLLIRENKDLLERQRQMQEHSRESEDS